ncbi:MAG: hypothetical protein C4617_05355 [Candidatus Liberibacter europaeus]|uniref:Lipoprotein n=1 Tax=Candidatus Liberibacter europaeus TaxID=744859 RepID=A0A2T4VWF0_9HYPH|nr:hypothetical protein [Candidatus Liberibacter europaeus]PTL86111.1 MAG: hypothetical protein C4617_05355 [Candidatus Liberibacter europaeus]
MKLLKYKSIILLLFIMSFSLISCDLTDEEENPGFLKSTALNLIQVAHVSCSGDRKSSACAAAVTAANAAIAVYNSYNPDDPLDEVSTETV